MKYHNFITTEDAAAKVAETYRHQGYAAYYLLLSLGNYQVRYWK